jgi:hypothetical protein
MKVNLSLPPVITAREVPLSPLLEDPEYIKYHT